MEISNLAFFEVPICCRDVQVMPFVPVVWSLRRVHRLVTMDIALEISKLFSGGNNFIEFYVFNF